MFKEEKLQFDSPFKKNERDVVTRSHGAFSSSYDHELNRVIICSLISSAVDCEF